MLHLRKSHEVTGYVPPDAGYELCVSCHAKAFPDHDPNDCVCAAIFLGSETDNVRSCDHCHEEIETSVIGGEDTWPRWHDEPDIEEDEEE
jgi:hypothetical protein